MRLPDNTFANNTFLPSEIGEAVRFVGYATGSVPQWATEYDGTVVRFTRAGNPVVRIEAPSQTGAPFTDITDRFGCARVIIDGALVRLAEVPA